MDRSEWRYIIIVGSIFMLSVLLGFFGGAALLGYNLVYLQSMMVDAEPIRLFDELSPGARPFAALLTTALMIPYFSGALFGLLLVRQFLLPEPKLFVEIATCLALSPIFISLVMGVTLTASEVYASGEARHTLALLFTVCSYFYLLTTGLVQVFAGWGMRRNRSIPRWLANFFGIVGSLTLLVNFFAPNPDLPAVRLIMAQNILSVLVVVWTIVLWMGSLAPKESLATTKLPHLPD